MSSLYEIDVQLAAIFAELEQMDGELTPELESRLDALQLDRLTKLDNILAVRQDFKRRSESLQSEINRLKGLATSADLAADRLKQYVEASMITAGEDKHELARFKVRIQLNPPGVKAMPDVDQLPAEYRRPQPDKPDSKALIEAWKAGKALPAGVVVEQSKSIRIS